ncbi:MULTISPECIES: TetR family transcriptional regulator [Streptomyces]|uniref:TetR family transcriptional regulator n=1 Tax=Streptomyces TaxID=1883 RepID=UPI001647D139|nr:TetR family transcriptional regulator [Streptomyces sp. CBG9]WTD46025.1 TetR family transcriptional regulator [Streptomyces albidoflavus]WTD86085.1 TetR family transcriptional regulator [Streptomyces albidoflavus]
MANDPKSVTGDEPGGGVDEPQQNDLWGYAEVAKEAGVTPGTIRYYWSKKKHLLPAPHTTVNGKPLWRPTDIRAWAKNRLGRGYRSDLETPDA